jgi:acetamidase/formamidase
VETHDAFEGVIETEDDLPSEVLGDYLNPQNGPVYVEGATPGDALAITIESEQRDEQIITKPELLAIGDKYEAEIAADRALDAPYR